MVKHIYLAGRIGEEVERKYELFKTYTLKIIETFEYIYVFNPLFITWEVWKKFGFDRGIDYLDYTLPLVIISDEVWIIPSCDIKESEGTKKEFYLAQVYKKPIRNVIIQDNTVNVLPPLNSNISWAKFVHLCESLCVETCCRTT